MATTMTHWSGPIILSKHEILFLHSMRNLYDWENFPCALLKDAKIDREYLKRCEGWNIHRVGNNTYKKSYLYCEEGVRSEGRE